MDRFHWTYTHVDLKKAYFYFKQKLAKNIKKKLIGEQFWGVVGDG